VLGWGGVRPSRGREKGCLGAILGTWAPLYRSSFRLQYAYNTIQGEKDSPKPTPSGVTSSGLCPTYALPGRILRGPILVQLGCSLGLGLLVLV